MEALSGGALLPAGAARRRVEQAIPSSLPGAGAGLLRAPGSPACGRSCGGARCMAKGKGGGGNKGSKKGSSIPQSGPAPTPAPAVPYLQGDVIMHSLEVIDSYFRAVGSPVFAEPVDVASAARALWEADFAFMSHGTEEDPIYNYGNQKTLELMDSTWAEFVQMPSRLSAPEEGQTVRNQLLADAQAGAKDISGVLRQTSKGRLFRIDDGVLWTLIASDGENIGQAAVLRKWHFLDEEEKDEGEGTTKASEQDGAAKEVEQETAQAGAGQGSS